MTIPLWIIAICAAIWTARMFLLGALEWIAEHYRYSTVPAPIRWFAGLLAGGRW